ncbi:MAG TPA: hypothetical protein VFY78_05290 [Gammaproteobacteria bacterium]|nr:hypothetical protein [Gammaproteobacteria bacterium]
MQNLNSHFNVYICRDNGAMSHTIMNNTFWVGLYPGLSEEMLSFTVDRLETFLGVNF